MVSLNGLRVITIATDGVEEAELVQPVRALRESGAQVDIVSPKSVEIQMFQHFDKSSRMRVDRVIHDARPDDYQAMLLPGGALNADQLRADTAVRRLVQSFDRQKKPMAIICHAPWILISAGLVRDRTLTSYYTIEDDIRNAGGHWVDHETACDGNWVTSRQPSDIPAFNREMLVTFSEFTKPSTVRELRSGRRQEAPHG